MGHQSSKKIIAWGLGVLFLGASFCSELAAFELPANKRSEVFEGREIYTQARLQSQLYSVKNAMVVHASLERTRRILTHFDLFAGLVPYIDRSKYDPMTRQLDVGGGIWKYRLESVLQFTPETPDLWKFRIIRGHFLGMVGALEFRQLKPGHTLVTLEGSIQADPGAKFPPRMIIEQGAQIIFAVTGRRVRSLVEDLHYEPQEAVTAARQAELAGSKNDSKRTKLEPSSSNVPKPRSGIGGIQR
ncbi:MAG: hypothetical protein KGQ59_09105 [Bdellovibrionales bacterium]|nr:hypothetical protein [Bdellovibrionales bacterium]